MAFGLLMAGSASLNAQDDTYITGDVTVKVERNTLFYHGGDVAVTTTTAKVTNDGNFKIAGGFTNTDNDGYNFVNTYAGDKDYGQLIILSDNASVDGKVALRKPPINPADFSWGQFAIPFQGNISAIAADLFSGGGTFNPTTETVISYNGGTPAFSGTRYNRTFMEWDNTGKPEWDHEVAATVDPSKYYIVNLASGAGDLSDFYGGALSYQLAYNGVPAPSSITVTLDKGLYHFRPNLPYGYSAANYYNEGPPATWADWKDYRNSHSERYVTYIEDRFRTVTVSADTFGRYFYQYGNPYTSNIDLSDISSSITLLSGVAKYGKLTWNIDEGSSYSTNLVTKATWNGSGWIGDAEALIIRPFEPFIIAVDDDDDDDEAPASYTFTFDNNIKTFAQEASATVTPVGGRPFGNNGNGTTQTNNLSIHQLGLDLNTNDGFSTGNRVYVGTSEIEITGEKQGHEAVYAEFGTQTGLYLLQENIDETYDASYKLFINTVNSEDYVAKPIHLGFNVGNDNLGYSFNITSRLSENGNLAVIPEGNFSSGNTFYFYDSQEEYLTEVTADFSYSFTQTETTNDRFIIYWNGVPEFLGNTDIIKDQTQVYKDSGVHKVRFDKTWTSADVTVYDISGKLVSKYAGVDTSNDLTLVLAKTAQSYVVKIVNEKGEVVTRKIVSK